MMGRSGEKKKGEHGFNSHTISMCWNSRLLVCDITVLRENLAQLALKSDLTDLGCANE